MIKILRSASIFLGSLSRVGVEKVR